MEALIPQRPLQRPSERMGINPADGPLSRGAVIAVDAGFDATQQAALQAQEIANAKVPRHRLPWPPQQPFPQPDPAPWKPLGLDP